MKYVILRDDDTNALTPIECLERLYRPFLDRGLPVNLAVIPNASTSAYYKPGQPELFLLYQNEPTRHYAPIGSNPALVNYLKSNRGFQILQHGCHHDRVNATYEFNHQDRGEISRRLDEGLKHLQDAGFERPNAFVAPYDQLSKPALEEVARRFRVLSTGWFELKRIPISWWPHYAIKKTLKAPHWRVGGTALLSHPGCHLSYHRACATMLDEIKRSIETRKLTVLVTHWWEYFRNRIADGPFIDVLHETADYLAGRRDCKVITFDAIARENISLN
jgi:hypothetical protein